ncbi:MAG TPA: serine hydrolase [Gemmatimonadaceae bacterium]|nr:serine hydrolase [Gemmatimonadaceae bacterium]
MTFMSSGRGAAAGILLLFMPVAAGAQASDFSALDRYIEGALAEWEIPGAAVAIVRNDSVVHARGYGVRKIGDAARIDDRTMFAVASTTKAFTAALIAMLVDEKKMQWDDPATLHLPGFQLYDPYVTRELTVRDLLSHRSGLSRGDLSWYGTPVDRDEVIRRVRFLRPTTSFRSNYGYQNVMYVAASQAAARVAGKSWDELIDERIFTPLGMNETVTSVRDLVGLLNVAQPHALVNRRVVSLPYRNVDNIGGAGAMNSNVREMAQWLRLQLADGIYGGRQLISPASIREMRRPHTIVPLDTVAERINPTTHFRAYALGWNTEDYRGRRIFWHAGNLDGMSSVVGFMPEEKLGIVVLVNMNQVLLTSAVMRRVWDMQLGGTPTDWSRVFLTLRRDGIARADSIERKLAADRIGGTRPSLALERYAGTYSDSLYGQISIRLEGTKLVADAGASWMGDVAHWHYDTFRITWRDPMMGWSFASFVIGPSAKVESMRLSDWSEFRRDPERIQSP